VTCWINPQLPDEITSLELDLRYSNEFVHLDITQSKLRVVLDAAARRAVSVGLIDTVHRLEPGAAVEARRRAPTAPPTEVDARRQ
jgi:trehalose/maltose hydrolase-like predicted phosphorylase